MNTSSRFTVVLALRGESRVVQQGGRGKKCQEGHTSRAQLSQIPPLPILSENLLLEGKRGF